MERLLKIMDELREKCPWDAKQTIHSLRQMTIEETYELTNEIDNEDWDGIKEELGDLLLHIIFYCKIASEKNKFNFNDVVENICDKLVRRHPHVYGNMQLADAEAVKQNWEKIKLKEGKKSILQGIPKGLPAMIKAQRIQEKAKQVGFEWDNTEDVWKKIKEEENELLAEIKEGNNNEIEKEMGDVLFSYINLARYLHVDAEAALEKTNKKFMERFEKMEHEAQKQNLDFAKLSLAEKDALWNKVKK